MRPGSRKIVICALLAAVVTTGLLASAASGERSQVGHVIVSLGGEITPNSLPRTRSVPVSISLSSNFYTDDGSPLPQLRRIEIGLGSRGGLRHRGLPICRSARVRATTQDGALDECRQALVGRGSMDGQIRIEGQKPFPFNGRILVFNSRRPGGEMLALGGVHSSNPPVSFLLPFELHRRDGGGMELKAELPHVGGGALQVSHFDLTLGRRFSHQGETHGFLNASCDVPRGFTSLVFPLARATYSFAGGRNATVIASRACSVRNGRKG